MRNLKFFLHHHFSLGFCLVTIFALFRIISYYNTFLVREVYLQGDDAIYAMLTRKFLEGDIMNAFHPYWNSGFPLATVPFYLITQSFEKAQILLSMTASILMIYAMYFTLARINFILGVVAGYLTAFSVPLEKLTLVDGWTEPLYILLLWIGVFCSWQVIQTQQIRYYILTGIFLGLSYFVRTDSIYTLLGFILFLVLSLMFERRKEFKIVNSLTISAIGLSIAGYIWWVLTSTNFLTKTTINYQPKATFMALFIFLGVVGIFGLFFKLKEQQILIQGIRKNILKLLLLFLIFLMINLPYIVVISQNLEKLTISGKYGYMVAGHFFTPERDRLTTFAQDVWSLDYPNYESPYYDSGKVYAQYLKNIDTSFEFFPKKLGTDLSFYSSKNMFNDVVVALIFIGIFLGLVQRKLIKFTVYLLALWFINLLWIAMVMDPAQRYLAYSYPFVYAGIAFAIMNISGLINNLFSGDRVRRVSQFIVIILLCGVFFKTDYSSLDSFLYYDEVIRYTDQKILGEWIKSQNIKVIMARTEGISFYSGAKLVYVPAAPPDVIIQFAKNWGVEYILSRPHESSWPYMKAMVDPNFKHQDLKLVHSFPDGSLVWKVALTEEEKNFNYRTGKPITVFCRSNEWSSTNDSNLDPCPDRNY